MARKAKSRVYASSRGRQRSEAVAAQRRRRRLKFVTGTVVLVLVLGIGGFLRWRQQRDVVTQLQGTSDRHYTQGPDGAAVVIKEFSDYT